MTASPGATLAFLALPVLALRLGVLCPPPLFALALAAL